MIVLREKTTVSDLDGQEWKVFTQWLKDGKRIRKYVRNYLNGSEVSSYYS